MKKENLKKILDIARIMSAIIVISMSFYINNKMTNKQTTDQKTISLDVYDGVMSACFNQEELSTIKDQCLQTPNPKMCAIMITHTASHETNCGKLGVGRKNNLFGMTECFQVRNYKCLQRGFKYYSSRLESIQDYLDKYKQYRYKNSCVEMLTRSKYCTSECTNRVDKCHETQKQFDNIK